MTCEMCRMKDIEFQSLKEIFDDSLDFIKLNGLEEKWHNYMMDILMETSPFKDIKILSKEINKKC